MPNVITVDNMPAVLAEAMERVARLEAELAARDEEIAEQAIQIEELQEQDHIQAAAFRAAQTQLPATIRAIAGTGDNGSNGKNQGNGSNGKNQSASARGNRRGDSRSVDGDENVTDDDRGRPRLVDTKKVVSEEPPAARKKAHRWT